jgi:Transposase domain (DUF772)
VAKGPKILEQQARKPKWKGWQRIYTLVPREWELRLLLASESALGDCAAAPALVCEVQVNLAYRWFCKLGIEDAIPDQSTDSPSTNNDAQARSEASQKRTLG